MFYEFVSVLSFTVSGLLTMVLKTQMQNQKPHKGKQPKNTLDLGWAEFILFINR